MALLECAKLCFRFGEASLLASRATTPALKPNHKKAASPRSTPSAQGSLPGAARVCLVAGRDGNSPRLGFLAEFLAAFCGGADGLDEGVAEALRFESFEPGDGGAARTGDFIAENGWMTLGL